MSKVALEDKKVQAIRDILEAATEVFAEEGFGGARVDEIARRAGVNKAMMYYRIGDKATLYAEVLHHVFSGTADRLRQKLDPIASPEEKLRIYVQAFARTVQENPRLPPIMLQEVASGGRNLPDIVIQDLGRILLLLTGVLEEGVEKGVFVEANPVVIHIMVIATISMTRVMRPRLGEIAASRQEYAGALERFETSHAAVARDVEDLILRALKTSP